MKLHLKSLCCTLVGAALSLVAFPQTAEAVVIYPQPQLNGMRSVTTRVNEVQVIMRSSGDQSDMWKRLPDVPEGYAIDITPGKLTV